MYRKVVTKLKKRKCSSAKMKSRQERDSFESGAGEYDNHNCNGIWNPTRPHLTPPQRKRNRTPPNHISPLLINHVLEQIFSGMSTSDLKNFRLVCKEWNAAATKSLQSKLDFIRIGCRNSSHTHSLHYSTSSTSSFTPSRELRIASVDAASSTAPLISSLVSPTINEEQLKKFLRVISSSTNPPFTKFEILSSFFIPENQIILQNFFKLSSRFIQTLKISLDNRAPGDFDPHFLTGITFPKLKSTVFEVLRQFTLTEPGEGAVGGAQVNTSELRDNEVSYRILSGISFSSPSLESLEVSLQRKCAGEDQRQYNLDGTPNFEQDRRFGLGDGGTCPCQHFTFPVTSLTGRSLLEDSVTNQSGAFFPFQSQLDSSVFKDSNPGSITTNNGMTGESDPILASPSTSSSPNCHLPLPVDTGFDNIPPRLSNSPKLKRLHLRLRNSFIHQTCVTSLLERLAGTLETFCLSEEGHGSRVLVELPKMKKLTELKISSICEFEENFISILPFSYNEHLPNLVVLNLWDCFGTERRFEQLFLSSSPSHTLAKLVLPSQFRNVSFAQNIPRVFPNLKSLTLVFSTRPDNLAVIETVFQVCGESLEELHLITDMDIQNQNVDYVLTGLSKEICQKMRIEENFILPLLLHHDVVRKASLVNLKRLKRLIFQLEHKYSRAPLITDVTGYLAFMEMPNLEYLRFTRYGMTWNCCEALSRKCRTDILSPYGNNVFEFETFDIDFDGI